MATPGVDQGHDRRTVEITYVVISSVVPLIVAAVAYKFVLAHVATQWQPVLSALGRAGGVLVIALLIMRGVRLLRSLEVDLHPDVTDA